MSFIAIPDDLPATKLEAHELADILRCLRVVRAHGGWGEITLVLKAGEIGEIKTTYTEKPQKSKEL